MQLKDIHKKFYESIPENVFWQIVQADPTYDRENSPQKKGKYTQWLLHCYKRNDLATESLAECTALLDIFNRYRPVLEEKDIMKYPTVQSLRDALGPYLDDPYANEQITSKAMRIRKIKEGAEKVYEDEDWVVFVPHTWEASQYYGKGTRWCTAYDSTDNFFNQYNNDGPLYININRHTKKKWQFHFASGTFCNERDFAINVEDVNLSKGLIEFYNQREEYVPSDDLLTFADAIESWRNSTDNMPLRFEGYGGNVEIIETFNLPPNYTNLIDMFRGCWNIIHLNLSRWNVAHVRSVTSMFRNCENLLTLNLSGWDLRETISYDSMLEYCDNLTTLTLDGCKLQAHDNSRMGFRECRALKTISMLGCDMDTVGVVWKGLVMYGLTSKVKINLVEKSPEDNAYQEINRLMAQLNKIIDYKLYGRTLDEITSYFSKLTEVLNNMYSNPLFFVRPETYEKVKDTYNALGRILSEEIPFTYITKKHGIFNITRPNIDAYRERLRERDKNVSIIKPSMDRAVRIMPDRYAYDAVCKKFYIACIPNKKEVNIKEKLESLSFSNRWHVTIPALTTFLDRISNNTRKGIDHLRYTALDKLKVALVLGLCLAVFIGCSVGIAERPGSEYIAFGLLVIAIIQGVYKVGLEKMKEKREYMTLIIFAISSLIYLLITIFVVRPMVS